MFWEPIVWNITNNQLPIQGDLFTISSLGNVLVGIVLGLLLMFAGVLGILWRTTSILLILLCFELALLGLNLSIIFLGLLLNQPLCLVLSLMLMLLSAVETAIGLSLLLLYYRVFNATALTFLTKIRF